MNLRDYLIGGALWAFIMRSLNAVLSLVLSAVLARMLSVEALGGYFLAFSIVVVGSVLARFGLGVTGIRLVADALARDEPGMAAAIARKILIIGFFGATFVASVYHFVVGPVLAVHVFQFEALNGLTMLIAVWIAALSVRTLLASIFRGLHAIRLAATFNGVVATTITLALLLLFSLDDSVNLSDVLLVSVIGSLGACVLALLLLVGKLHSLKGPGVIATSKISSIAWRLYLTGLAGLVLSRGDILLLGMLTDGSEVALYGVAARLITLIVLPVTVLGTIVSPLIARYHARQDLDTLERLLRVTSTVALLPAVVVLVVLLSAGEWMVTAVFGTVYAEAYPILLVLTIGTIVSVISGMGQQVLIMTGHERTLLIYWFVAGLIAVATGTLVADAYGALGVALAFSLCLAILNIALAYKARKYTGLKTYIYSPGFVLAADNRKLLTIEFLGLVRRARGAGKGA